MGLPQLDISDVVCIASGPSLTQDQVDYVRGRALVIAINDNYRLAPWADVLYACDAEWIEHHNGNLLDFEGLKVTQDKESAERFGWLHVQGAKGPGLSLDRSLIHYGQNSGFQAINVAYHLGAKRIILIGYDMQAIKRRHWFGNHPASFNKYSHYESFIRDYQTIADQLPGLDIEIINCTEETALKCFTIQKLKKTI